MSATLQNHSIQGLAHKRRLKLDNMRTKGRYSVKINGQNITSSQKRPADQHTCPASGPKPKRARNTKAKQAPDKDGVPLDLGQSDDESSDTTRSGRPRRNTGNGQKAVVYNEDELVAAINNIATVLAECEKRETGIPTRDEQIYLLLNLRVITAHKKDLLQDKVPFEQEEEDAFLMSISHKLDETASLLAYQGCLKTIKKQVSAMYIYGDRVDMEPRASTEKGREPVMIV